MPENKAFIFSVGSLCATCAIYVIERTNSALGYTKGPASPLHTTFPSANWAANPTNTELANQKLIDIGGTDLVNSTGGPDDSWSRGDRVELGFFASSFGGDGNPVVEMIPHLPICLKVSWVPLTIEST